MSLSITLNWQRQEATLTPQKYSNAHEITYTDDTKVMGDAAPDWGGNAAYTNPEQALAAAMSSCHMMTFLALAAKAGWPVASYSDHAVAHLGKSPKGRMAVTRIDLHPKVTFDTGFSVDQETLDEMQHRAHRYCFVANSIADYVAVTIS